MRTLDGRVGVVVGGFEVAVGAVRTVPVVRTSESEPRGVGAEVPGPETQERRDQIYQPAIAGASERAIMNQTGYRSATMVRRPHQGREPVPGECGCRGGDVRHWLPERQFNPGG